MGFIASWLTVEANGNLSCSLEPRHSPTVAQDIEDFKLLALEPPIHTIIEHREGDKYTGTTIDSFDLVYDDSITFTFEKDTTTVLFVSMGLSYLNTGALLSQTSGSFGFRLRCGGKFQ